MITEIINVTFSHGWVVTIPSGDIDIETLSYSKKGSIDSFLGMCNEDVTWEESEKRGYKCIKRGIYFFEPRY